MAKKGGLGRGLDALFAENDTANSVQTLKLSEIEPNKNQPRKDFDEEKLAELAQSINEHGIIQPLVVRPMTNGRYVLVAGERRWRAARMAGLSEAPVVIREMSDSEMAEIALIENLQREDLNPIEEAFGYKELMDKFDLTQDEVAKRVNKSRPAVANALRLINLPESVYPYIRSGKISAGHARALLSLPEELIEQTAGEIAEKGLTVREIEKKGRMKSPKIKASSHADSYYEEMRLALTEALGKKVEIENKGKKSLLTIEFYDKDELSDIARRITGGK